jgi:hypothetical protein
MIRSSLGQSLTAAARLVKDRAIGVLDGVAGTRDGLWQDSAAASDRLDAVLRQYMDEATGEHIDPEALMALAAAALRLRRASEGMGRIPIEPWYEKPGLGSSPQLEAMSSEVSDWYARLGDAIMDGEPPPAALSPDPGLPRQLVGGLVSPVPGQEIGADVARIWMYENLAYLSELSVRFNQRARELFHIRNEGKSAAGG